MTMQPVGDLANGFMTRLATRRAKAELQALTQEMSTGRSRDPAAGLGGDMSALVSVEQGLSALGAYSRAADEARLFLEAAQSAIGTLQHAGSDFGPELLRSSESGQPALVEAAAGNARARLQTVIGALNTTAGGRSVFAGTATGGPAVAGRTTLLDRLDTVTGGETTAAGVVAQVDSWFAAPGGYQTDGYLGADTPLAPFRVAPDREVAMPVTAADPDLRDVLTGYALAALAAEGTLTGAPEERAALVREAGIRIMSGDAALARAGARIGGAEAALEDAEAARAAERTALEQARDALTGADPYRTATALTAAQTQLETLYALTARLSGLSLAEYLK